MTPPQLSVLVTGRNIEPYIAECLDSVLAQDYQDFEVRCCDDASDDATFSLMQQYAGRDNRIHVQQTSKRLTALPNLQRLIVEAEGEIVAIVDGDDYLLPGALSRHMAEYAADPNVEASYGSYKIVPNERPGHTSLMPQGLPWYWGWTYGHLLAWKRNLSLRSFTQEPEQYLDADGKPYTTGYDVPLFFPVLARAKAVAFIPDIIYAYRKHSENDDATPDRRAAQKAVEERARAYWKARDGLAPA